MLLFPLVRLWLTREAGELVLTEFGTLIVYVPLGIPVMEPLMTMVDVATVVSYFGPCLNRSSMRW
jgi:hypothetical protein